MYKYSISTGGFYVKGYNTEIPNDAVDISEKSRTDALEKLSNGYKVSSISSSGDFSFEKKETKSNGILFVTRAQGKAALIRAGLWQGVLSYVASIEDETEKALAEVELNDRVNWNRSSEFLNAAAKALGLTDEQLDDLFLQASKIE